MSSVIGYRYTDPGGTWLNLCRICTWLAIRTDFADRLPPPGPGQATLTVPYLLRRLETAAPEADERFGEIYEHTADHGDGQGLACDRCRGWILDPGGDADDRVPAEGQDVRPHLVYNLMAAQLQRRAGNAAERAAVRAALDGGLQVGEILAALGAADEAVAWFAVRELLRPTPPPAGPERPKLPDAVLIRWWRVHGGEQAYELDMSATFLARELWAHGLYDYTSIPDAKAAVRLGIRTVLIDLTQATPGGGTVGIGRMRPGTPTATFPRPAPWTTRRDTPVIDAQLLTRWVIEALEY